ncbi:M16 family metallopeptidase [Roseovarius sp. MS2]|uniref:M16 family metallopeptidase n=1 Tax=Roseovarius sp. MS2 TaxID=3390728 RepID=UPI003EDBA4F0
MRHFLAGLTLALLPLAAPVSAATTDQVTHFTLDNGLDVVVIEDHRAPVVTQMLWYRAGSADETPGVSGVAHFLEHLLFKGTKTMEPGEFSATVARNGGSDNAFTSYDYTAYFQRIAADRLELVMRMESDRMTNLQLDEADILTERDVIIEERNQRVENSPGALFREQKNATQYLNHRYGVPIIGWRHEMEALDLDAALDFYRTFYAPNNAILIIAGDVTPDAVRALADTYYGPIPANPALPERARPQEPPQLAERRITMRDARVSQPYVTRSYLAPERDSGAQEKAAALTLLADILGGGQTSLLAEKLQFQNQTAVQVGASYSGLSLDDTTFDLFVVPAPGVTLEQAEAAMDEALLTFLETGVDAEQLERIKTQFRASETYARDDAGGLANRYGQALTQGLTVADVQAWPAIIQATTEEDILQAARDVLDRTQSVTGWLMAPEVTQ